MDEQEQGVTIASFTAESSLEKRRHVPTLARATEIGLYIDLKQELSGLIVRLLKTEEQVTGRELMERARFDNINTKLLSVQKLAFISSAGEPPRCLSLCGGLYAGRDPVNFNA